MAEGGVSHLRQQLASAEKSYAHGPKPSRALWPGMISRIRLIRSVRFDQHLVCDGLSGRAM